MPRLLLLLSLAAPAPAEDPALQAAIAQVRDGDFEKAMVSLNEVIDSLSSRPQARTELASAYFHLGVAYVGLKEPALAKAKFLRAIQADPALRADPDEHPARVVRLFADARSEFEASQRLQAESRRKGWKKPALIGGLGVAGAAAIAATAGGARENHPPSGLSIRVSPGGVPIGGVTEVTFRAEASDPDGDALTYEWALGGTSASGQTTTHTFPYSGTNGPLSYPIVLTVSDGVARMEARQVVPVTTPVGRWRIVGFGDMVEGRITQHARFGCVGESRFSDGLTALWFGCVISAPRHMAFGMPLPGEPDACGMHFEFDLSDDGQVYIGNNRACNFGARCATLAARYQLPCDSTPIQLQRLP